MKAKLCAIFLILSLSLGAAERVNLLLDWYPNPDHVPLYVGVQKGFFEEEGIDLHILKVLDRPHAFPFLEAKRADIIINCAMPLLRAAAVSKDLVIIGHYFDEPLMGFAVLEESPIQSVHDFKQQRVAATLDGTVDAVLKFFAKKEQIAYGEVKNLQIGMPAALAAKKVDVISGIFWNVEPYKLKSSGIKTRAFSFTELGVPTYPELLFIARKSWAKEKGDLIAHFHRALNRSIEYSLQNPDKAFDLYAAQMIDKSRKTLGWERESWKATLPLLKKGSALDREEILNLYVWMDENGLLKRRYDVNRLFLEVER